MIARVVAVALASAAGVALAAEWRADVASSRLEFVATFERAPASGVFKAFDARIDFDTARPADGRIDVTIDVASADMANGDVNREIRGPEWFDVARHPQARFTSNQLRSVAANRYVASGTLALKGIQRAVDVPFAWSESGGGAAMEGELTLPRAAFRIGTGEWAATNVIGPDVVVRFRLRLRTGA